MEDKKYTVYTHRVVTEDNGPMYYVGVTCQKLRERWRSCKYKDKSLWSYIEKYGWDNIEHSVFAEGLDRETAYRLEGILIKMYRHFDCCINKNSSGMVTRDIREYKREYSKNEHMREYMREYMHEYKKRGCVREHLREYMHEYNQKSERKQSKKEYHQRNDVKERRREYLKTTEYKIYDRVSRFNKKYPDRIIETPLEAKRKYLESGYIPDYIRHDDL